MNAIFLLIVYCVMIVLASLTGGWLPSLIRMTHLRMQLTMSLVSGLMLGVSLLHLLPEAFTYCESSTMACTALLCGLLVMFVLMRLLHVHHHGDAEDFEDEHAHCHHSEHSPDKEHQKISWMGLFFGLAVHTLLDGVALASAVLAEQDDAHGWMSALGFGTFLAVALHKPLDALSITALMKAEGWSETAQAAANAGFALACPIGALGAIGVASLLPDNTVLIGCTLAFSAGFFLCIALSDLLPEVQFHSHDKLKLMGALFLGVFIAFAIESLHSHKRPEPDAGTGPNEPISSRQPHRQIELDDATADL